MLTYADVKDLEKPGVQVQGLAPDYVKVLLKSSVKEVTSREMTLNDGTVIPYGVAVWAAGTLVCLCLSLSLSLSL